MATFFFTTCDTVTRWALRWGVAVRADDTADSELDDDVEVVDRIPDVLSVGSRNRIS